MILLNICRKEFLNQILRRNQSSTIKEIDRLKSNYKYFQEYSTRWKDNDQYGHVNNVISYEWIDSIVNQYLINECKMNPDEDLIVGYVVSSYCCYYSPLKYPQRVQLGLNVQQMGKSSVDYRVGIFSILNSNSMNNSSELASVVGGFRHVFVHREEQKAKEIPKRIRENLEKLSLN